MLAGACAGEGVVPGNEPTPVPSGSFGEIQRTVFNRSCTSAACHNAATRAGNLSLAPGESYDDLVNIEPENAVARGAGLLRVTPGSVDESFLVAKLTGDLAAGEGSMMPLGAGSLPESEIDLIRGWIEGGALPDSEAAD